MNLDASGLLQLLGVVIALGPALLLIWTARKSSPSARRKTIGGVGLVYAMMLIPFTLWLSLSSLSRGFPVIAAVFAVLLILELAFARWQWRWFRDNQTDR